MKQQRTALIDRHSAVGNSCGLTVYSGHTHRQVLLELRSLAGGIYVSLFSLFNRFLYILEGFWGPALSTLFSCVCSYPLNALFCAFFPLLSLILKKVKSHGRPTEIGLAILVSRIIDWAAAFRPQLLAAFVRWVVMRSKWEGRSGYGQVLIRTRLLLLSPQSAVALFLSLFPPPGGSLGRDNGLRHG